MEIVEQSTARDTIWRFLESIKAGRRVVTEIEIQCPEVDTTPFDSPASMYTPDGKEIWIITVEPAEGRNRFVKATD